MYTSDTDRRAAQRTENSGMPASKAARRAKRCVPAGSIAFNYLAASAACAAVGLIYELFSHGVWSAYMVFGYLIPLMLGALPNFIIWLAGAKAPGPAAETTYACGVITLTAGSLLNGALAIYGTTNTLIRVYPITGGALLLCGALTYIFQRKRSA